MSDKLAPALIDRRSVLHLAGGALAVVASIRMQGVAGALGVERGGLLQPADANGWRLLPGFTSRSVATSASQVADTGHTWHLDPDGGATFPAPGGGWTYVSNSERREERGGVGSISFDSDGNITGARSILAGTTMNCAGGATPWGTWLSCEEHPTGLVYECDPTGATPAVARPAMGAFQHEAVAAAPNWRALFLTEDRPDGVLYRFTPDVWGDLSSGTLQVLVDEGGGALDWEDIPDPAGTDPYPHQQVPNAVKFDGAEGIDYIDSTIYFTTKGDNRIWQLDLRTTTLSILYDAATHPNPQLTGPDNLVITPQGDVLVVEDGGNLEIVFVTRSGEVTVVGRYDGPVGSELTGPAFDPSGTRLYVSSQRSPGETFEISGPFAGTEPGELNRFENTHPDLVYAGDWFTWNNASQSGGSSAVAAGIGATLTYTFTGDTMRVIGQLGPQRGRARVTIDGMERATIDTFANSWLSEAVLYEGTGLGNGEHVAVVEYLGPGPNSQGSGVVLVDAVEAVSLVSPPPPPNDDVVRFENDHPDIAYSGSWFTWNSNSQSGGSAAVGLAGATCTVTFTGPTVRWIGQRGRARAIAEVRIDGNLVQTVDTYAANYASQVVLFEATDLGEGTKTLTITNAGANPSVSGTPVILVDAIEAVALGDGGGGGGEPELVTYENTSDKLTYGGNWFTWNHPSQSGGSAHVAPFNGATCRFTVNGSSVRWIGQRGRARGIAEVRVDGTLVATVDCYAANYASGATLWSSDALGAGNHNVEIRLVGANPAASGTPAILVDTIQANSLV
ncbi:MAG: alkaline phosphatase PhoX [Actinomycetota bacterium]